MVWVGRQGVTCRRDLATRSLYGRIAGDNISTMVDGHYIFDFPSMFDVYDDDFPSDG